MPKRSFKNSMSREAGYVALLILAFVALAFDIAQFPGSYRQFRTSHYAQVQGRIIRSRLDGPHRGGSYNVDIEYTYTIDNRGFGGNTWRFAKGFALDYSAAEAISTSHPVNGPVTVYYDPKDPSSSLLSPGLNKGDFFFLLIFLPFNLILVGVIVLPILWMINPHRKFVHSKLAKRANDLTT